MRKALASVLLSAAACLTARSQVIIINDNLFQGRMSEISATVLDSLTREPVPFASMYVIPSKDTTITNFTLTDAEGKGKLDEVPYGSYTLRIEMMGYKPYVKERYFRERREDMGTVLLQTDEQFLDAAVVSDVGNPIIVKQDTVEFNASSFRVGSNAMLKDLLKRMPGMEVTEDGKVKFNGEEIDHITVGGRTFFFGDQSTALNNLPASIVDKVRVIDRESESARASGIKDGSREKVLDVGLKKEYEKGWFGNAGLKLGATAGGDGDDGLRDDRGLLYSGNALVSAYNENDQLTVIANGQNINDSNAIIVMRGEGIEDFVWGAQGLASAGQLALNYNTTRIKDVESTVGANYKYTDTQSGSRTSRTTYSSDGDLVTDSESSGRQFYNSVSANGELKKEKGKVWFHLRPHVGFDQSDAINSGSSSTSREAVLANNSESRTRSLDISRAAYLNGDMTVKELWGKKERSVQLVFEGSYGTRDGRSDEYSLLSVAGGASDIRDLHYDSDGVSSGVGFSLSYNEPLSEKWMLSVSGAYSNNRSERIKDAFDTGGYNEYYSSESRSTSVWKLLKLTAQYKFSAKSWIQAGLSANAISNELYSRSYGVSTTTGKDEWERYIRPELRVEHSKGNDRFSLMASAYSSRPSQNYSIPSLNITDPASLSVGNIYLRPYSRTYLWGSWHRNNREKFSNLMVFLNGQLTTSQVTQARWYDTSGILYSVPVNAEKPALSASLNINYTTPLDKKKLWSLQISGGASLSDASSYQAKTLLPGLAKDSFDYTAFMDDFWGNKSGDRFFGGLSGFERSRTTSFTPSASTTLKYNQERWSLSAGVSSSGHIARYSLNPDINLNTVDTRLTMSGMWTSRHEFEFESDLSYAIFSGYASGYGDNEWQWNASVSRNIGAFNLSLSVHDILDQTRNLTHMVKANYVEDSYRLVMGRYILFGVKWNFGKMNAAHSARAQMAAFNSVW